MTKEQFDTVDVGDVLLANNGRHIHITVIREETLHFYWEAGISNPSDYAGRSSQHFTNFGYRKHISKGTIYGTHRTLRHKADFKTKP